MAEGEMQPNALKITIKLKNDNVAGSLTIDDLNNKPDIPESLVPDHQDQVENASEDMLNNDIIKNEENQAQNSKIQLMCYDSASYGARESILSSRQQSIVNRSSKMFPSIGAFTVQCANCFKWRLIPSMEKYEEIRENILETPFFCEAGQEWRPDMSCDDPPDITQDGSRLWAIDKPNIPRPPSGWKRILRIRGEGGTKFADVYYSAPSGKRLRSLLEVQRFLTEHPGYVEEGVDISKFSFQIPRPLQENYVRKRVPQLLPNDVPGLGPSRSLQPVKVLPLAWMPADVDTEMQLGRPGLSDGYNDYPLSMREHSEGRKKPSKRRSDSNLVHENYEVNVENPFHL